MQCGKVEGMTILPDSSAIDTRNKNPILSALVHDVEFKYGYSRDNIARMIDENMITITDANRYATIALEITISHRKNDTACNIQDKNFCLNGQRKLRKSTQGFDL